MKIERTEVFGWDAAIRGMRNPKNSWDRSDSGWWYNVNYSLGEGIFSFNLGEKDLELAQKLIKGGPVHSKFLRYIHVQADITAPLYWWKEYDTYKVGTVANSTSTMHKLAETPITIDCFETDDYYFIGQDLNMESENNPEQKYLIPNDNIIENILIPYLEGLRVKYLETKDKRYWKELIRWLPEGWLQTRTVDLNYEVLRNIYKWRKSHKLSEWNTTFCNWVESLPYAKEFILFDN